MYFDYCGLLILPLYCIGWHVLFFFLGQLLFDANGTIGVPSWEWPFNAINLTFVFQRICLEVFVLKPVKELIVRDVDIFQAQWLALGGGLLLFLAIYSIRCILTVLISSSATRVSSLLVQELDIPNRCGAICRTREKQASIRGELHVVIRFFVHLEAIDPFVVIIELFLSDVVKVDFPKVNLSSICSTCNEALLIDRNGINMLIAWSLPILIRSQLNDCKISILAILLTLRARVGSGLVGIATSSSRRCQHSFPCPTSYLIVGFVFNYRYLLALDTLVKQILHDHQWVFILIHFAQCLWVCFVDIWRKFAFFVKLVLWIFTEGADIIDIDRAVIGAWYQKLIILGLLSLRRCRPTLDNVRYHWLMGHVGVETAHLFYNWRDLFEVVEILNCLLFCALNHCE